MHNSKIRLAILVGCMALSANLWAKAQPVQATLVPGMQFCRQNPLFQHRRMRRAICNRAANTPAANASPSWAA